MKTYTQYRKLREEEEAEELNKIKPTNEIIDEVNENIDQLEELIEEDFDYPFDLHAEIVKDKISILSEDCLEGAKHNRLARIMFKKLKFDAFGEQILEHSNGKCQFEIKPRMSFENYEGGNFYQEIGDDKIVYYYSFDTKKWNRR